MEGIPRQVVKTENRMKQRSWSREPPVQFDPGGLRRPRGRALPSEEADILPDVFNSFERVFIVLLKVIYE